MHVEQLFKILNAWSYVETIFLSHPERFVLFVTGFYLVSLTRIVPMFCLNLNI